METSDQNKKKKNFRNLHEGFWKVISGDRVCITDYALHLEIFACLLAVIILLAFVSGTVVAVNNAAQVIGLVDVENVVEFDSKATEVLKTSPQITARGGAGHVIFTDYWYPEDPEAFMIDGEALKLKAGYDRALFEYGTAVPPLQDFELSFVSDSKHAVNLSFGRSEFYEIVVGDNDMKTLSLKVVQKINGDWVEVPEFTWQNFRPESNAYRPYLQECTVTTGEEFSVQVEEKYLDDSEEFRLTVTIRCDGGQLADSFTFYFSPTPNWEKRTNVYLGLIDYSEDSVNETKVYFTEPDLVNFLKSE